MYLYSCTYHPEDGHINGQNMLVVTRYKLRHMQSNITPMGQTSTGEYKWYQERIISFG